MTVENRRHPRTEADASAQVRWVGRNRWPIECDGTIRDYSRSGLRVELARDVPPASQMTVTVNGKVFRGVVRYCQPVRSHYEVGIEF